MAAKLVLLTVRLELTAHGREMRSHSGAPAGLNCNAWSTIGGAVTGSHRCESSDMRPCHRQSGQLPGEASVSLLLTAVSTDIWIDMHLLNFTVSNSSGPTREAPKSKSRKQPLPSGDAMAVNAMAFSAHNVCLDLCRACACENCCLLVEVLVHFKLPTHRFKTPIPCVT